MELTHLVHALRRRPLVVFLVGGVLLYAGKRAWVEPEPTREVTVQVAAGATPAEIERATDEAILLAFAVRSGFATRDVAVRRRLIDNMRFATGGGDDDALLERAIALGMHESDAIARARLLWLAEESLAGATHAAPADAELDAHLRAHPERFRQPPRFTFEQIFVSRQREDFDARVRWASARLEQGDEVASDPSLLPAEMRAVSESRIAARFGADFAMRVAHARGDGWLGPVTSTFGAHFVRVRARVDGVLPPLSTVRDAVRHDFEHDSRARRVREALGRLRQAYRIEIAESA